MRKLLRYAGILILIAIGALIIGVWVHKGKARSELSRYKAELVAKGEKLKFSEFTIPPSTNAEHIASRMMFATNDLPETDHTPILMEFIAAGKARVAWGEKLHLQPTNEDETMSIGYWDELARENKEVSGTLQEFVGALSNPAPDSGRVFEDDFVSAITMPRLPLSINRRVGESLSKKALLDLHQGHLESAISNLNSMIALTQLYQNEPVLICEMVRVAVAKIGLWSTWEALLTTNWSEAQLANLQERWERVELLNGLEQAFRSERALEGLMMEKFRNAKTGEFMSMFATIEFNANGTTNNVFNVRRFWEEKALPLIYRTSGMDEDELLQLKTLNGFIESARMLKTGTPAPEAEHLMKETGASAQKVLFGAVHFRFFVSRLSLPTRFEDTLSRVAQVETLRRLTITAIALKRYQLKHGAPPRDLAALTPEFLGAVPIDPMSGKALCFRLKVNGTFVLYSVGEDGKDDGGDPTRREADGKFGLWEGRDAVWPVAATEEEEKAVEAAAAKKQGFR